MAHVQISNTRRAGVLLHPTSLPSGKLDGDAERWLDWLASAGFGVWQVLPLGMPQNDLSPYQSFSAFAVNTALLPDNAVSTSIDQHALIAWCARQAHWLQDYALFMVLHQTFAAPWYAWPEEYRQRERTTLLRFAAMHRAELDRIVREQFLLDQRWHAIRHYARARDIWLFGDMPIFVAHDSADVWANPQQFLLDADGQPSFVTGVPPDYFSAQGQRWGNPHYHWEQMQRDGFRFWIDRLQHHFDWFDLVRIDHFRGLDAVWMIPASEDSAINGHWVQTPGAALLERLRQQMGVLPLVAEDLGIITPEVIALRKQFDLPGMAVLQFGFDAFDDNPHKLHNIHHDCVAYTGTHDNDTTRGWFDSLDAQTQAVVLTTLGISDDALVVQAMLDRVLGSKAALAMLPLQDLLGLDNDARMNTPGTVVNNWQWRFAWSDLDKLSPAALRQQLAQHGRSLAHA
jgi:4-alpha-glucanotransferase